MAVLAAYFDDSGSYPEHPLVVMCGAVASTKQWKDFSIQWNKVLRSEGISVFHMADCENFEGEFKGWTPIRKRDFIVKLIEIVKKYKRQFIGSIVFCKDFDLVKPKFPNIPLTHKQFCINRCILHLSIWMEGSTERKNVTIYFDRGNPLAPEMVKLFCEKSTPKWKCVQGNKEDDIPLQAADLIAYDVFKYKKNELEGWPRPPRKSILSLLGNQKQQWSIETPETIASHLALLEEHRDEISKL